MPESQTNAVLPSPPRSKVARKTNPYNLSSREIQIWTLLNDYATYGDLADAIGIARTTVVTHVSNLFGRLGVKTKADAVALYRDYQAQQALDALRQEHSTKQAKLATLTEEAIASHRTALNHLPNGIISPNARSALTFVSHALYQLKSQLEAYG